MALLKVSCLPLSSPLCCLHHAAQKACLSHTGGLSRAGCAFGEPLPALLSRTSHRLHTRAVAYKITLPLAFSASAHMPRLRADCRWVNRLYATSGFSWVCSAGGLGNVTPDLGTRTFLLRSVGTCLYHRAHRRCFRCRAGAHTTLPQASFDNPRHRLPLPARFTR